MIRILMVAIRFPPYFAGAAVQAVHLAKELQAEGVEVQFITDNDERKSAHEIFEGLKVYRFATFLKVESPIKEIIYAIRLFIYLLRHASEFDVVHFHSTRVFACILFPVCRLLGKKVILKITLLDSDDPISFSKRKMGKFIEWGLGFVDRFVVISSALLGRCLQAGQPQEKVRLIYNGVDTQKYSKPLVAEKQRLKEKAGYDHFDMIFLSVGMVEHRKGYDLLLEAWPKISSRFTNAALLIVGPGAEATNAYYLGLQEKIAKNALKNVFFTGEVSDSSEYMRISDCFLFCSRAEGFGSVLIEAMACEVPVVAMNIPKVTEDIVRDKRIGRICFTLKPDDFANETIDLLSKRDVAEIGQASHGIRSCFGINRIAKQYIELYEELLHRDGQPEPVSASERRLG